MGSVSASVSPVKTAMILAAGRGERMRPLTDTLPKPMLEVKGKPLLQHHIEALSRCGIERLVINHAWCGKKIEQHFGSGQDFGVEIVYSPEEIALETAGGIKQALPLIGDESFVVVNGDVFTDFDFSGLQTIQLAPDTYQAHLVLVDNPEHHPQGDFSIAGHRAVNGGNLAYTYSGIGLYSAALFKDVPQGRSALGPLLRQKMDEGLVSAEHYGGMWCDVGTPQRLHRLNCGG